MASASATVAMHSAGIPLGPKPPPAVTQLQVRVACFQSGRERALALPSAPLPVAAARRPQQECLTSYAAVLSWCRVALTVSTLGT